MLLSLKSFLNYLTEIVRIIWIRSCNKLKLRWKLYCSFKHCINFAFNKTAQILEQTLFRYLLAIKFHLQKSCLHYLKSEEMGHRRVKSFSDKAELGHHRHLLSTKTKKREQTKLSSLAFRMRYSTQAHQRRLQEEKWRMTLVMVCSRSLCFT